MNYYVQHVQPLARKVVVKCCMLKFHITASFDELNADLKSTVS